MKKVLIWLMSLVILIGSGLFAGYLIFSMKLPDSEMNDKAEELADRMLATLNYHHYQKIKTLSWTFKGKHHYRWQKNVGRVSLKTETSEVELNFATGAHRVIRTDLAHDLAIERAIANFYNDSFWLVAPFKIRDKGTQRGYVQTEDGPGILVSYSSGGVTPGDQYLWVLDENYRPKYWRLWTSNVPIPGLKFKWTGWQEHKGVWFATDHYGPGSVNIEITDLIVEW